MQTLCAKAARPKCKTCLIFVTLQVTLIINMNKVLVVEDDQTLNKIYVSRLKEAGYKIQSVFDGEAAVIAAKDFSPDLIILDLLLPKKDGYLVLEELKKNSSTKNIPVVVTSNLGQTDDVEKALGLGANDFLIKSNVSLAEMLDKVKLLINKP